MTSQRPLQFLRLIGFLEGLSFLILLLIAMPLKYLAETPEPVKFVGAAHGGLFILYVMALTWAGRAHRWSLGKIAVAFLASFLPAGTFFLEPRWRTEQLALGSDAAANSTAS